MLREVVTRREALICGLVAVSGCASQRLSPSLNDLYAQAAPDASRPPLIIVPGAFSTRLRRRSSGEEIWPRTTFALATSNYADIGLEIDPRTLDPIADDVETAGLFLDVLGRDFYRSLLHTIETAGGYTRGSTKDPLTTSEPAYYVYEYDWRQDVTVNARGLHALIEQIAESRGDPRQQVDILAHSSGGLLARYYARYGVTDVLGETAMQPDFHGSRHIRRLLLVGTPNLGTIQAVLSHVRGEEVGLRHIPEEVVATCPGATQLMPHPAHDCLIDTRGDALPFDLYDIKCWRELRWSIFSERAINRIERRRGSRRSAEAHLELLEAFLARQLARGRRFHMSLSVPAKAEEPRPYLFGGDCTPTLSKLVVRDDKGGYEFRERPPRLPQRRTSIDLEALMHEPGDGVVTRSSLLGRLSSEEAAATEPFHAAHSVFLCAPHRTFMADQTFQDNFLYTLLQPTQSWPSIQLVRTC